MDGTYTMQIYRRVGNGGFIEDVGVSSDIVAPGRNLLVRQTIVMNGAVVHSGLTSEIFHRQLKT